MSDPFFSQILALVPFNGSGQTFVDHGPLHNAVSFDFGAPDYLYEQNNSAPLFGGNTLSIVRPDEKLGRGLVIKGNTLITPLTDLCIEYQCNIQSLNIDAVLMLADFIQASAPNVYTGKYIYNRSMVAIGLAATGSKSWRSVETAISSGWHGVAVQHVASLQKLFMTVDGVLIGSIGSQLASAVGWMLRLPTTGAPKDSADFSMSYAQLRVTAANRYGDSAAPVQSGPWPLS